MSDRCMKSVPVSLNNPSIEKIRISVQTAAIVWPCARKKSALPGNGQIKVQMLFPASTAGSARQFVRSGQSAVKATGERWSGQSMTRRRLLFFYGSICSCGIGGVLRRTARRLCGRPYGIGPQGAGGGLCTGRGIFGRFDNHGRGNGISQAFSDREPSAAPVYKLLSGLGKVCGNISS